MKKKIALLLCIIFAFTMITACSDNHEADGKQNDVVQKEEELTAEAIMEKCLDVLNEADSMDMTMVMQTSAETGGQEIKQNVSYSAKMNNIKDNMEMYAVINTDMDTEGMTQIMYFKDGVCYMEVLGEKYKMEMDVSEAMSSVGGVSSFAGMSVEDFAVLEKEDVDDGYKIKFELAANAFSDMINGVLGEMADGANVSVDKISGSFNLDKEFMLKEATIDMTMGMEVMEGMEVAMDVTSLTTYSSIGEHIDITFPDFSEYKEMEF